MSKPGGIITLTRKNSESVAAIIDKHTWKNARLKMLVIGRRIVKNGTLHRANTTSSIGRKSNAKRLSDNSLIQTTIVSLTALDMRVDVLRNGIVGLVI